MGKRVAVFFHPYFSNGGVERTNIFLAKGLIKKGYEVEFLTTVYTDHFSEEVSREGIRFVELGEVRTIFTVLKIKKYIERLIADGKYVYFIGCQYYVNVVSMFVSVLMYKNRDKVRFINSERNHFVEFDMRGGVKGKIILLLVKMLYCYADVVVANSKETARDLQSLIGRKVSCVYNPTVNDRIESLKKKISDLDKWFVSDARPTVIAVGRMEDQKDFVTLIKAFSIVRKRLEAKLVIIGEGERKKQLEYLVKREGLDNDVFFKGFVGNPYPYISESDVFVLSSRYEGLPNVLIEAVFLEVPCVSTCCKSGPKEILLGGRGGILVDVGDVEGLARGIVMVLENPSYWKSRVKLAKENLDRFKCELVQEEFERVINQ